jgi:protein SCO1/2
MSHNNGDNPVRTDRRTVLAATGTAVLGVGSAGCLGVLGGDGVSDDVVLSPPENYDQLSGANLPFPIHGEQLPDTTVPAPLAGREVTTTEFVGERHVMLTFVFTRCSTACPLLTANLVQAQAESIEAGFADEMAFLDVTFDPEYDTAEVLESYAEEQGVDREAGNWWFLRPESPQRAREVVTDTFGVAFQYVEEENREMQNMAWLHSNLVLLANADGYVERAYNGETPNPADVVDDVTTLHERW